MERTTRQKANDLWKSIPFSKGKEKTHQKTMGTIVTPKKLKKILELNKTKRELTDEQVLEMKELYKNDLTIGLPQLAEKYGVDKVSIMWALTGKTYSEVGEHLELREPLIKCEHCKELQTKGNYTRWHGDECNLKGVDVDGIVSEYKQGGTSIDKLSKKWGLTRFKIRSIINKNK